MFREAGPLSLLALGMFFMPGLLGVMAQALIGHRVRIAPGSWVAVMLPLTVGLYGYRHGMKVVEDALATAGVSTLNPRVAVALRAQGFHEAVQNVWIGGGLSAVLTVLMVAALGWNVRQRRRARTAGVGGAFLAS